MVSSRFQKRLQSIINGPRSVSRRELVWVMKRVGFEESGGKGSHKSFKYPGRQGFYLTLPDQDPLRVAYVREALKLIDELLEGDV